MKTPESQLQAAREWRARNPEANRRISREGHRKKAIDQPGWYIHRLSKGRARKIGLEFTISQELVESLVTPMVCAVTGLSLRWDRTLLKDDLAPSLDRIDNAKGYVPGNVRIVCWMYNRVRGEWSDAEAKANLRLLLERLE